MDSFKDTKDAGSVRTENSQIYIGIPNGIVLCADQGSEQGLRGRFYHLYSTEPVLFENEDQLIFEMEKFFDSIQFPHPGTHIRIFEENRKGGRDVSRALSRRQDRGQAAPAASLAEPGAERNMQGSPESQAAPLENGHKSAEHQGWDSSAGSTGKRTKVMKDQELLSKHGDMGSFIIRVQQRQNSSMQGRLTWVEKNKTVYFRSVWELIRLIDSAVEISNPSTEEELPSWED